MESYFNYMANHWWVGGILSTFIVLGGLCLLNTILKLFNRIFRSLNIMIRGWPPSHLDGDGDWKPSNEDKG